MLLKREDRLLESPFTLLLLLMTSFSEFVIEYTEAVVLPDPIPNILIKGGVCKLNKLRIIHKI